MKLKSSTPYRRYFGRVFSGDRISDGPVNSQLSVSDVVDSVVVSSSSDVADEAVVADDEEGMDDVPALLLLHSLVLPEVGMGINLSENLST